MNFIQKAKYFSSGVAFTLGIILSIQYAAAAVTRNIEVVYNNIQMIVDGRKIIPTDGAGNAVDPFIYNGTTYLPVRAVGQALGKDVTWDGPNNTVIIGQGTTVSTKPDKLLIDLSTIKEGASTSTVWKKVNSVSDFFGNTYGSCYVLYTSRTYRETEYNYHEYALNSQYRNFKGTLSVSNATSKQENGTGYVIFYADDQEIYRKAIQQDSEPVDFNVSIPGCNRFRITIVAGDNLSWDGIHVALIDAGFYK